MSDATDPHVLVVHNEPCQSYCLAEVLRAAGMIVEVSDKPIEAVMQYLRMCHQKKHPRAIMTDWWIEDKYDKSVEAVNSLSPESHYGTAKDLIDSIFDMDPGALVVIYTKFADDIPDNIRSRCEIVDRDTPLESLASHFCFPPERKSCSSGEYFSSLAAQTKSVLKRARAEYIDTHPDYATA